MATKTDANKETPEVDAAAATPAVDTQAAEAAAAKQAAATEAAKAKAAESIIEKQQATIAKMEKAAAKNAKELKAAKATNIPTERVKEKPAKKPTLPKKTFEVEGEKYKFRIPRFSINIKGNRKTWTAEEAISDADVCAHLVTIKSSVIEKA